VLSAKYSGHIPHRVIKRFLKSAPGQIQQYGPYLLAEHHTPIQGEAAQDGVVFWRREGLLGLDWTDQRGADRLRQSKEDHGAVATPAGGQCLVRYLLEAFVWPVPVVGNWSHRRTKAGVGWLPVFLYLGADGNRTVFYRDLADPPG
jgi:hypothetical protein